MIWIILGLLGVPLWLCALGILALILGNRKLRKRPGNIPVRVQLPGKTRWRRGNAIWVSDVFAFRTSPASWTEALVQVTCAAARPASTEERSKLRRLADDPAIASLEVVGGASLEVAVKPENHAALLGPFSTPVGAA